MISIVHLLINQRGRAHSPPIGALAIQATLARAGYSTDFTQFCHLAGTELAVDDLVKHLSQCKQVIFVSTMINALPYLVLALRRFKAANPDRVIVVGGPGMLGVADNLLDMASEIDAVSVGEGESIVEALAESMTQGCAPDGIPGVGYRTSDGLVTKAAGLPRSVDLDRFALPNYSLVNLDLYHSVGIAASRGCPFSCTFCDVAPAWGRRNTHRSVENVLGEIEQLQQSYGVRSVGFVDDLFIIDKKWVRDFCREKIKRKVEVSWRCNGHVNLVDESLMELMCEAGCTSIFMGIESGSDRVLSEIKKGFRIEKALRQIELSSKYMRVSTNFMWGFQTETVDDLQQTLCAVSAVEALGAETSLVMLAALGSAPMLSTIAPSLFFDPVVPNIFCADYLELRDGDRNEWLELISTHPSVFSAFYYSRSGDIAERIALMEGVTTFRSIQSAQPGPRALWQRV